MLTSRKKIVKFHAKGFGNSGEVARSNQSPMKPLSGTPNPVIFRITPVSNAANSWAAGPATEITIWFDGSRRWDVDGFEKGIARPPNV